MFLKSFLDLKSFNWVSRLLKGCLMFQGSFKQVLRVFPGSLKGVLRKFQGNFKGVYESFKGV